MAVGIVLPIKTGIGDNTIIIRWDLGVELTGNYYIITELPFPTP